MMMLIIGITKWLQYRVEQHAETRQEKYRIPLEGGPLRMRRKSKRKRKGSQWD